MPNDKGPIRFCTTLISGAQHLESMEGADRPMVRSGLFPSELLIAGSSGVPGQALPLSESMQVELHNWHKAVALKAPKSERSALGWAL